MKTSKKLKPTVFAIFGGSGDLTRRKLIPSLYSLYQDSDLPEDFPNYTSGTWGPKAADRLFNPGHHWLVD